MERIGFFVGRSVFQAVLQLLDVRIQPSNFVVPFCIGQMDRNMQRPVPIERIDMNDNSALGFRTVVDPQQTDYIGVFRDHGVPEQFQAFLTDVIDGDQRYPVVMAQIAEADVLPVPSVVGITLYAGLFLIGWQLAVLIVLLTGLGFFVGTLFGTSSSQRTTLALETGVQNSGLGLAAAAMLSVDPASFPVSAVPSVVYSALIYTFLFPVVLWLSYRKQRSYISKTTG